jgi:hypothetical protein
MPALETLQTLLTFLTLISIPVGVIYHIMTLRNTRKNQELQLETRSLQLFMQLYQDMSSPENVKTWVEIMNWEWNDYDDWTRKYVEKNQEAYAKRASVFRRYNTMGIFLRDNRIDSELLYDYVGTSVIGTWDKYGRLRNDRPELLQWFEYLADEMKKIRKNRGITSPVILTGNINTSLED